MDRYVDVLIPRGGKSLIERVALESRIPVIKHYEGICHQYLAADAPVERTVAVTVNSKCQRVEVCNALETLLVDGQFRSLWVPDSGIVRSLDKSHCQITVAVSGIAFTLGFAVTDFIRGHTALIQRVVTHLCKALDRAGLQQYAQAR